MWTRQSSAVGTGIPVRKVSNPEEHLVARTGRQQQRYVDGCRLVAGCIPYRHVAGEGGEPGPVEVMMISSSRGEGLVFPKGGWETDETAEEAACREAMEEAGVRGTLQGVLGWYAFQSKSARNDKNPHGACQATVFVMAVTEQLDVWPESHRQRYWLPLAEAIERCRHDWMCGALREWGATLPAAFIAAQPSGGRAAGQVEVAQGPQAQAPPTV